MHQYLLDTAFAADGLINLIIHDSRELTSFEEKQKNAVGKETYFDMEFMHRQMDATANYWHGRLHEAGWRQLSWPVGVNYLGR